MSSLEDIREDIASRRAYQLASDADCTCPDSPESAGADFLTGVRDAVLDQWTPESEASDLAWEVADAAVPIYTFPKWQAFTDLAAWQEDIDDYGPVTDLDQASSLALYVIAERLAGVIIGELVEASEGEE